MTRIVASALLLALFAGTAHAHDYTVGAIKIDHPWARATPKGASVAGGYMKITNTGTTPDRLVGGTVEVAKRFEVHEMSMDGGVMKMREVAQGLDIAPGATVELKPGGFHIHDDEPEPAARQGRARESLAHLREGRQGRHRIRRRGDRLRRR